MIKNGMRVLLVLIFVNGSRTAFSQQRKANTSFHVLVLAERGGIHEGFVVAALEWLNQFSAEQGFDFRVINRTDSISTTFLSKYQEFIQLNFPPY
ncbi:MAG TPA: hypothetical protein VII28_12075, partial [Puia sp.]